MLRAEFHISLLITWRIPAIRRGGARTFSCVLGTILEFVEYSGNAYVFLEWNLFFVHRNFTRIGITARIMCASSGVICFISCLFCGPFVFLGARSLVMWLWCVFDASRNLVHPFRAPCFFLAPSRYHFQSCVESWT